MMWCEVSIINIPENFVFPVHTVTNEMKETKSSNNLTDNIAQCRSIAAAVELG